MTFRNSRLGRASFEGRGACHRAGHFGPDPLAAASGDDGTPGHLRMTDRVSPGRRGRLRRVDANAEQAPLIGDVLK
jgi:hypothetical protein